MNLFALIDHLDRAGVEFAPAVARGFAAALDELAAEQAPDGALGRFGDRAIERACGWTREPGRLVEVLVAAGALARSAEHRLVLVGWSARAPDAVHAALARARALFADGSAPRLGPLSGAERKAASSHYAEAALLARSAESARSEQLPFFFFSESGCLQKEEPREEEEKSARPRSAEPPRRAVHRVERAPEPAGVDEAIERARAAATGYGVAWGEIRSGPRRALAADVMRSMPERGLDALAHCVHGFWALRGRETERWKPRDYLRPETVWGPKRSGYLGAFDDARAAGREPPFLHGDARAAPRSLDAHWKAKGLATLLNRCGAAAGVIPDRDRKIYERRGRAALSDGSRQAFEAVMVEIEEAERFARSEPAALGGDP